MTENVKITRTEALDILKQRIGGCFGTADGKFGDHTNNINVAKELRKFAYIHKITILEMREITLGYLQKCGYLDDHINIQLEKATKMFNIKINNNK